MVVDLGQIPARGFRKDNGQYHSVDFELGMVLALGTGDLWVVRRGPKWRRPPYFGATGENPEILCV